MKKYLIPIILICCLIGVVSLILYNGEKKETAIDTLDKNEGKEIIKEEKQESVNKENQKNEGSEVEPVEMTQIALHNSQNEAFNKFNRKYKNKLRVKWSDNGLIDYIIGFPENELHLEDIDENFVKTFLKENRELFSLKENLSDLNLTVRKGDSFANYTFQQTYNGIPVFQNGVTVKFGKSNITRIGSSYDPNLINSNLSYQPKISENEALEIAKKDLDRIQPNHMSYNGTQIKALLLFYPNIYGDGSQSINPKKRDLSDYHLVWMTNIVGWSFIIDANDGKILSKGLRGAE